MPSHRILLTGANGFIASHILSQLLSTPTNSVRAVVRSQSKVDAIKSLFPAPASQLDYAIVPDITAPEAFDEALKSNPPFDIVMHTASPFLYKAAGGAKDFLEPAIKGTTEVLAGIQRVAKNDVKRVILTSSFAAVGAWGLKDDKSKVYTEEDWNPITYEAAVEKNDIGTGYLASKTLAERAAWEVVEKEKPGWDLVVLNPPMVYGPLVHKVASLDELNESTARIWNGFFKASGGELPPNGLMLYVDVRDIAQAHVLAMDAPPEAGNNRFITSPGNVTSQEIADILHAKVSGVEGRVPKGEPGKDTLPGDTFTADTSKVQRVLGLKYTPKEKTIEDLGKQLLEIEAAVGGK